MSESHLGRYKHREYAVGGWYVLVPVHITQFRLLYGLEQFFCAVPRVCLHLKESHHFRSQGVLL